MIGFAVVCGVAFAGLCAGRRREEALELGQEPYAVSTRCRAVKGSVALNKAFNCGQFNSAAVAGANFRKDAGWLRLVGDYYA